MYVNDAFQTPFVSRGVHLSTDLGHAISLEQLHTACSDSPMNMLLLESHTHTPRCSYGAEVIEDTADESQAPCFYAAIIMK